MIEIASNGHLLTHIPQPIQRASEMKQIFAAGATSIQNFPYLFSGQVFLHSC